jgi:antitoxin component YwqK of YwqJK toxin-antitoxin module
MSTILSLHDLPKELVDLVAKAIRDLKSWLHLRLTCKRCWTLCSLEQYRVQFLVQVKFELETYHRLPNGLKHGEYKEWHNDGGQRGQQLYKLCFYKDDQLEGEYKRWYENGQLRGLCFYKDGRIEGESKEWYKTGQLWEHCFFKDWKHEGEYNSWYEDGQSHEHYFYKDGQPL